MMKSSQKSASVVVAVVRWSGVVSSRRCFATLRFGSGGGWSSYSASHRVRETSDDADRCRCRVVVVVVVVVVVTGGRRRQVADDGSAAPPAEAAPPTFVRHDEVSLFSATAEHSVSGTSPRGCRNDTNSSSSSHDECIE
jgi:hypothetical protein